MKRPPFKMLPSRWAQARRLTGDPRQPVVIRSGRASYVWLHSVLVPIACGVAPDGVEIRRAQDAPWHLITLDADEAYEMIRAAPRHRAGILRVVEAHRRRRGLPVAGDQ